MLKAGAGYLVVSGSAFAIEIMPRQEKKSTLSILGCTPSVLKWRQNNNTNKNNGNSGNLTNSMNNNTKVDTRNPA